MRIAVSSTSFARPLAAGELTQLEWVERCASELGADGVLAAISDFPRTDGEYVAQLRKVAIDLGVVPFGLDAPAMLWPTAPPESWGDVLALATGLGAAVIRTELPPPGEVPPASFVEAVAAAKALGGLAKAANVTLIVAPAFGTLGEDLAAVRHLLKDVDSAWLRACPRATVDRAELGTKDRYPAFTARVGDEPGAISAACSRSWVIVDDPQAARPWTELAAFTIALRDAEAKQRLGAPR